MRCRIGSHRNVGKNSRSKLQQTGYYEEDGTVIRSETRRMELKLNMVTDWSKSNDELLKHLSFEQLTGDIDHMTGGDGSDCYLKTDASNPVIMFSVFAIDGVRDYVRPHAIQWDLGEKERRWQARCCTTLATASSSQAAGRLLSSSRLHS